MAMTARRRSLKFGARLPSRRDTLDFGRKLFARASLWQVLRRDARHPIASHFSRQLKPGRRVRLLPLSIAYALLLFFVFINAYSLIGDAIIWTLPLWLMLFSLSYCTVWMGRIIALMSRQAQVGILDEVSMIPPGQAFVFLVIGKVVLNEGDALAWLTLLRRYLAVIIFFSFFMALCVASMQISQIDPLELAALATALTLVALVIPLEHSQSAIIACLTAILVCTRLRNPIDKTSIAFVGFALMQILSYSLAIALVVALEAVLISIAFALYLLVRELLIAALWTYVLRLVNEDDYRPRLA